MRNLILTFTILAFPLLAESTKSYVIAGQTYAHEEVMRELTKARKTYGFDPVTRRAKSLETLKAKRVKGSVYRQTGQRVIVQTDTGAYIAVQVRPNSSFEQNQNVSLALQKRGSKIKERIDGNEFLSIQLYQDITLRADDMVKALNHGKSLKGVQFAAVQSRNDRLKVGDRPATQFDRRTITIKRKGKK